ncbi:hypothetical protein J2T15_001967 [Paenibacillus harenae]|uniref:Uncharacterized protein n=1 Tax=Paenibacillus harenae TaxID=306543 RepID=A0ABT9TYT0_PAEHA|nr:hypothetical protein [Paenibacillus harenae]
MQRCFETNQSLQELLEELMQDIIRAGLIFPDADEDEATV